MLADSIFGKSFESITINDLEFFFQSEQIENDKLEFKSLKEYEDDAIDKELKSKDVLKKIMNTICAFLNTDGGILIWGAPEGIRRGRKEKIFQGELLPINYKLEKDQFISKVSALISPTPNRIRFQVFEKPNDSFVYVFEAQKSEFSPHQVNGTYYMRMDGQTRAAPHAYVEALMKKISVPKLSMHFYFGPCYTNRVNHIIPISVCVENLSTYTHDRNVTFRLISNGKINKQRDVPNINGQGTDIKFVAAEVIHNSAPILNCFFLILRRDQNHSIDILAYLAGDLSPMLMSVFKIELTYTDPVKFGYSVDAVDENIYVFERKEKYGVQKSGLEIAENYLKKYLSSNGGTPTS